MGAAHNKYLRLSSLDSSWPFAVAPRQSGRAFLVFCLHRAYTEVSIKWEAVSARLLISPDQRQFEPQLPLPPQAAGPVPHARSPPPHAGQQQALAGPVQPLPLVQHARGQANGSGTCSRTVSNSTPPQNDYEEALQKAHEWGRMCCAGARI